MKFYGIKLNRRKEKLEFNITKFKLFTLQYLVLNKNKKKQNKFWYGQLFKDKFKLRKENSIPSGKYYIPACIVTSDLILRENISKVQSGLIKLIKHQYSHKFVGVTKSIDEIISNIENTDNILSSWYDSVNAGRFDFENNCHLKQLISYFDIYIRNVNSSYLMLEFHIYLSDKFIEAQRNIIDNDFEDRHGYVTTDFTRNGKKSGGKQIKTICHYNDADLKSDLILENMNILKWKFYNRIQKYFSTLLHAKRIIPPGIEIYKTNIFYADKSAREFWESVGVTSFQGQFIDESRKLFFKINESARYDYGHSTDLVYIVNEESIEKDPGYYSIDFQITRELTESISTAILKFESLHSINDFAAQICIKYRFKLNKIKLNKNKFSKLLKIRYYYERAIDFYKRYVSDDSWKESQIEIANAFENKHSHRSGDYRVITESPVVVQNKILQQIAALEKEFDKKTAIIQHLSSYKNEKKNRKINIVMLVSSIATVTFIIFPELSKNVSNWLISLWNAFKSLLRISFV